MLRPVPEKTNITLTIKKKKRWKEIEEELGIFTQHTGGQDI